MAYVNIVRIIIIQGYSNHAQPVSGGLVRQTTGRRQMAQTEDMKRLLLKGKAVGYQLTILIDGECRIHHSFELTPYAMIGLLFDNWKLTTLDNYIKHDSFEQGIKDNEWQFDGDIFKVTFINLATKHEPGTSFVGILKYLDGLGCWVISEGIRVSDVEVLYHERFDAEFRAVHLGNIHDNPELMEATDDTGQ